MEEKSGKTNDRAFKKRQRKGKGCDIFFEKQRGRLLIWKKIIYLKILDRLGKV